MAELGVVKDEISFFLELIDVNGGVISRENYFRFIPFYVVADNATINNIGQFYLRPSQPEAPESYLDVSIDIGSDINFKCGVIELAQTLNSVNPGNPVYMYSFDYRASFSSIPPWFGVPHTSEIDFIFGMPLIDSGNCSDTDRIVSKRIMNYWTTFAKTGNPNFCQDTCDDWNRYDCRDRKYQIIDSDCPKYGRGLREAQYAFLKKVLAPKP